MGHFGYIPHEGLHGPKGPFVLNKDSPQAQGLHWWVPLIGTHRGKDLAGGIPPDDMFERVFEIRGETGTYGATNISTTSDQNRIGEYDLGTFSIPYTVSALVILETLQDWAGVWHSHLTGTGGDRFVFGQDNNGKWQHTDFGGNNFNQAGPTIKTNELVLGAAVMRTTTDWTLYQASMSSAMETANKNATAGSSGNAIIQIGEDHQANRIWQGPIFDCRVYTRALTQLEIWDLFDPDTRWDLYYELGRISYHFAVPVVAGANPKGPLGMPLAGPFGGPI